MIVDCPHCGGTGRAIRQEPPTDLEVLLSACYGKIVARGERIDVGRCHSCAGRGLICDMCHKPDRAEPWVETCEGCTVPDPCDTCGRLPWACICHKESRDDL